MIPAMLCQKAREQVKVETTRALYAYRWDKPEEGRFSIINHPLIKKGQLLEIDTAYLGLDQGKQKIRGA